MNKDNIWLNQFWRHRLIKVLFVIISIIAILLACLLSDRYFFGMTLFYILLGTIIRIIVTNIIYYEWIIYIITGSFWKSLYRIVKNSYKKLTISKKNRIKKITLMCIWLLLLIKLIIFPITSKILSTVGNNMLDIANDRLRNWWVGATIEEQKKAEIYCNFWKKIKKTASNIRCLWRTNNDNIESKYLFLDALDLNPTEEEIIRIKANLAWIYYEEGNKDIATETINELFNIVWTKKYDDIMNHSYILLGYIASDKYEQNDAIKMFDEAQNRAKSDTDKFFVWMARAQAYAFWWEYTTALSVIQSIKNNIWNINNELQMSLNTLEEDIKNKIVTVIEPTME